ncbi:MAG: TauD/TfdA family dioxygenase [Gammaproteobacteria bacterium]|nr:TauD/TfdA family dioxygenase [Gammaproteobacteria bacterium]
MAYRHIEVRPSSGALGAEVGNVDLANLTEESFAEIHHAFLEHLVLFFREQQLTIEAQKAFGQRFGQLYAHPYVAPVAGHPEVIEIVKDRTDRKNFGGAWHADLTYLENPMLGAVLYALEVPPQGGDTLFANMYLAYETLSPGMQQLLQGLIAVHDDRATGLYDQDRIRSMALRDVATDEEGRPVGTRAEHPVLRTHPDTGRQGLFVNRISTIGFKDMTEAESRPLLDFLCQHLERPELTCRFRWTPGAVVLWDNRCTQHLALNDYHGYRRAMRRVLIAGDRPYFRESELAR